MKHQNTNRERCPTIWGRPSFSRIWDALVPEGGAKSHWFFSPSSTTWTQRHTESQEYRNRVKKQELSGWRTRKRSPRKQKNTLRILERVWKEGKSLGKWHHVVLSWPPHSCLSDMCTHRTYKDTTDFENWTGQTTTWDQDLLPGCAHMIQLLQQRLWQQNWYWK